MNARHATRAPELPLQMGLFSQPQSGRSSEGESRRSSVSRRTFAGSVYQPRHDRARLAVQIERIRGYMVGGQWRTLREIKASLETLYAPSVFPESSISAQLRNLKKPPYSLQLLKRRRVGVHGPGAGIWEYRLLPPMQIPKAETKHEQASPPDPARDLQVRAVDEPDEEFFREARRAVFPEST